jgi:tetratricopeptide (TPR) repeat protein
MEVILLSLVFFIYLFVRYFMIDHDTPADKDRRRFTQGIHLVHIRRHDEALPFFDAAVKQYPKSAVAYAYRGRCHLRQENPYSALYDLTQALSLDNTLAECYLDKGIAYYQLSLFSDAFREFDKAVWYFRGQQPDALRWRALARIQLHQLLQAERDLHRAVELGDENAFYLLQQPPFTSRQFINKP